MSEQPQQEPQQNLNISGDSSLENVQIGGIAGRDLNLTQIQGQVIYATVYDRIYAPDGLSGQPIKIESLTEHESRQREALLNKVKDYWIKSVLEKSLHNQVLIELGLEEKSDAIQTPFPDVEEFPEQSGQNNSKGTNVTDVFQQMGTGRTLLILGEPGSGKTTTLLKLAQSLVEETKKDLRRMIPVVFHLSSWAIKKQAIEEWLVEELYNKYYIPKPLGKRWIKEEQLILLLDGLDEVKAECRNNCVRELNKFTKLHNITEIVVSCRIQDYEALEEKLILRSAICIQGLTQLQIEQYLEQAGKPLVVLKTLLQQNTQLRAFVSSPLILSVMSLAYEGCSQQELSLLISGREWKQRLFDKYIERMFQRKIPTQLYLKKETQRWLIWLAQRMIQESERVFLIEKIQPTWLTSRTKNFYRLSIGLIFGILFGLINLSIFTWIAGLMHGLILGLMSLIVGMSVVFFPPEEITTVEIIQINWKRLLIPSFKIGVSFGLFVVLVGGLYELLHKGQFPDLGIMLTFLKSSLFIGIMSLLQRVSTRIGKDIKSFAIEKTINPNQGIWRSRNNALMVTFGIWIITGLAVLLMARPEEILMRWFSFTTYGLIAGLLLGGIACIEHFILRFILYINKNIPWNYARFLNYATKYGFLRKVGGGYVFVHPMLLEHFAKMELK